MRRLLVLVALFAMLVAPLPVAQPPEAGAAGVPMTITTREAGSGALVPGACYVVEDRVNGGGIAAACDDDDGDNDGRTVLTTTGDECDSCDIMQTVRPAQYLPADEAEGVAWGDRTFVTFLKPYLAVKFLDAHTRVALPGACITVNKTGVGGAVASACDGEADAGAGDQDGARNGVAVTKRLDTAATYTVTQTTRNVPRGYLRAAPVDVVANAAETGEFETVTLLLSGPADLRINTRGTDGKQLKGACYVVKDKSHGGSLGRVCDGTRGDDDGKKNAKIVIRGLPAGHTYLIDQKKAPAGYRLVARDTRVTTVDGANTVTIKTKPKTKPKRKR